MSNGFLSAELMASILKALTDYIDLQNELIGLLEEDNEKLKTKLVNAELSIDILQHVQPPSPWEPPPAPQHTPFNPVASGEQQAPQSEPPRQQGRPRPGF